MNFKPLRSKVLAAALCVSLTSLSLPSFAETSSTPAPAKSPQGVPANRVASIYLSEDFINEQIRLHSKSVMVQGLALTLDPDKDQIFLRGELRVPTEELRAINLDPQLGRFRFQVAIKLETTSRGHLIIQFPIGETYLYPVLSKTPEEDKVIVPVQMLSLALASVRGYLAALSGDFGGFNRRTEKLNALMKDLDHTIAHEKNPDALEDLKTQRESLRLQLEAVPIERKQLQALSKEFAAVLSFTGEKELSLNDDLAARKNALILKIKLSQLAPFLDGVDLGGIRIRHDKKDGGGQNYFVLDVNAKLEGDVPPPRTVTPMDRPGMKVAPALILRLNQSLFESQLLMDTEKKEMGSNLRDFDLQLKDDGLHVSGKWHTLLFFNVPFDTIVDFAVTQPDTFEARVREIKVGGIDFDFLTKFVLESIKRRLNKSLKGLCHFKYVGDGERALQATIDPKTLVPAFPDLHLIEVDVRDREFLMKIGKVQ